MACTLSGRARCRRCTRGRGIGVGGWGMSVRRVSPSNRLNLSTANHIFDPRWPDDRRWTMDDAPPSIVYRLPSKAGTLLRFDALSTLLTKYDHLFEEIG